MIKMNESIFFVIIDVLSKWLKIKNPYSKIIAVSVGFTLLRMICEYIIDHLINKRQKKGEYNDLHEKQDEFAVYYKEAAKKLPKLKMDPIAVKQFKRDSEVLQSYVNEMYTYLTDAYNAKSDEEIDRTIESMRGLIERLESI